MIWPGEGMFTRIWAPVPVPFDTKSWMRIPDAPSGPSYSADLKETVGVSVPFNVIGQGKSPAGFGLEKMPVADTKSYVKKGRADDEAPALCSMIVV